MKAEQSVFKRQQNDPRKSHVSSAVMGSKLQSGANQLTTGSTIFNDKYVLCQLIGKGAFGEVFRARSTMIHRQDFGKYPTIAAVKVQSDANKASQMATEISVIGCIQKHDPYVKGFPKIYASGIQSGQAFMIIDLLGPNLQQLMTICGGKFSLQTSLLIIIQILQKVEIIHSIGYVYRDIKPQNFVIGIGKQSRQVYIVDFGLCRRFRDEKTKLFLPYKENVNMSGTVRYASLNSHLGIEQTRRDDLEAVMYLLVYFLKGQLPWQGLVFEHKFEKDHMIMESKLKLSSTDLFEDLPTELVNVFEYIKSMDFYQDPDYCYILSEISQIYESNFQGMPLSYDWEKLKAGTTHEHCQIEIQFIDGSIPKKQEEEQEIEERIEDSIIQDEDSYKKASQSKKIVGFKI